MAFTYGFWTFGGGASAPPFSPEPTEDDIRTLAHRLYGSDDIEIDADAKVSAATDGGSWVQAWVYLSNETIDEEIG